MFLDRAIEWSKKPSTASGPFNYTGANQRNELQNKAINAIIWIPLGLCIIWAIL